MTRAPRQVRALALLALLAFAGRASAEDRPAAQCSGPVDYRGAPMHAPLPAGALAPGDSTREPPMDAAVVARLDSVVGWILHHTAAPSITAAVSVPGHGRWSTARGRIAAGDAAPSDSLATAPARAPYFYWGSAGKAFTATVVLQLVQEGKLALDDPLSKWFPDFPNARAITVEHLLNHTGGVFSFQNDVPFRKRRGYVAPDELVRIAARHGSDFCPGELSSYSNTGYVLLGLIVEQVEGRPFHDVVRTRILERIGMNETVALAPRQRLAGFANGELAGEPVEGFDPSLPFGAGIIVGSARDMVLFWQALLSHRLLSSTTLERAFARLYPMFDNGQYYGLGVMLYEFDDHGRHRRWLGHSGGAPGFKAVVAMDLESRAVVAVAVNADASAEASANLLLKAATGAPR